VGISTLYEMEGITVGRTYLAQHELESLPAGVAG
jgi:hypothetical protein